MKPVPIQQLIETVNGIAEDLSSEISLNGVSIDSRTVKPGEIFWAVTGENEDGSAYSKQAYQNGALAVVVSKKFQDRVNGPKIIVEDTVEALQKFARWYRDQFDLAVIGVTGSVGKTTTRELIYSVLSEKMDGVRSRKNYNNHLGVPLTLLEIDPTHQFAVVEMGASSRGEISRLCEIASPVMGVITAIAPAHLQEFQTIDLIVRSKAELPESLPETGTLFLPAHEKQIRELTKNTVCQVVKVDSDELNSLPEVENEIRFTLNGDEYYLPLVGEHFLNSALIAIEIGKKMGLSPVEIASGMKKMKSVAGRCDIRNLDGITLIDDTYNSSPASLSAAIELLSSRQTVGRKILVTGDMLALGETSSGYHKTAGEQIAQSEIDLVFACGHFAVNLVEGAVSGGMSPECLRTYEKCDSQLGEHLKSILKQEDVVLVKGSRGMKMELVVNELCKDQFTHTTNKEQLKETLNIC